VLLDDIRTTGGTLLKARELLSQHGASLVVAAVVCVRDDS
jgi:adenine/guanine phosphoribosyltransferase-like PRPP-binding protein